MLIIAIKGIKYINFALVKRKKKYKTVDELIEAASEVLKGKELHPNGKKRFEQGLKRVITPRKRSAK